MNMEPLNEDDVEWLTKAANRLIRMRKREVANKNSPLVVATIGDAIKEVVDAASWLDARFKPQP